MTEPGPTRQRTRGLVWWYNASIAAALAAIGVAMLVVGVLFSAGALT